MDHSYEEIRKTVIDLLAGRIGPGYGSQYEDLKRAVAHAFDRRGERSGLTDLMGGIELSRRDADLFLEVFWDLFRQGVITLGLNDSNPNFPFFRVSAFGRRVLASHDLYFFHDVTTYASLIREAVPEIDDVTLIYLKEAMQAFISGCLLSTSVMLGVATEHVFLLLLDRIAANPKTESTFRNAQAEPTLLRKLNKFRNILGQHTDLLAQETREDLDTNFGGILSLIRTFRNESGHPTGRIIPREQAYVLLQLFIPCSRKMHQLTADLGQ